MNVLGFEIYLDQTYEKTLDRVAAALKTEGFGVLTKIDVQATLKEKLGADFRPYAILGACNPALAHQALSADPAAGLMLPCNVTVEATDIGVCIRIANPETMLQVGDMERSPVLKQVAAEARQRLERVAALLREQQPA